jgi:hypothetical protein
MSFIRIRTIGKRRYLYQETRYREGKRVRSISRYIGPLDGSSEARASEDEQDRHYESAMREAARMDAWQLATFGETGAQRAEHEAREAQFDQSSFLEATAEPPDDSSEDADTENSSEC